MDDVLLKRNATLTDTKQASVLRVQDSLKEDKLFYIGYLVQFKFT